MIKNFLISLANVASVVSILIGVIMIGTFFNSDDGNLRHDAAPGVLMFSALGILGLAWLLKHDEVNDGE